MYVGMLFLLFVASLGAKGLPKEENLLRVDWRLELILPSPSVKGMQASLVCKDQTLTHRGSTNIRTS